MKTLVVMDETIVRFLLVLCETAKGVGNAEQEALRDETERQLKLALSIMELAKKEQPA